MSINQYEDQYALPLNTNGLTNQVYYMNRVWLIYVILKWLTRAAMLVGIVIVFNIFVQTINKNITQGFTDGWDLIVFLIIIILKTFWALTLGPRSSIFWSVFILFSYITLKVIPVHKKSLVLYRFNPKRSPVVETHVFTVYNVFGRTAIGIETKSMNRFKRFIVYALFEPEIYILKNPIPSNPMDTTFLVWAGNNGISVEIEKAPCFFVDDFEHSGAIIELVKDEQTGEILADLSLSSVMSMAQTKFINEWPNWSQFTDKFAKQEKMILEYERKMALRPMELAFQYFALITLDDGVESSKNFFTAAKKSNSNYEELVGRKDISNLSDQERAIIRRNEILARFEENSEAEV